MGDECAALYADGIGEDAPRHVLTTLLAREMENNYDTNPYKLKDHGIPPSVLASLHDAALKHLCGDDSLIYPDQNSS
ncbi:19762_t:CDS:2 [Rhizophagus irregularis]|nr:19762_t:CDS:2 [Rhizophagus irregularis]